VKYNGCEQCCITIYWHFAIYCNIPIAIWYWACLCNSNIIFVIFTILAYIAILHVYCKMCCSNVANNNIWCEDRVFLRVFFIFLLFLTNHFDNPISNQVMLSLGNLISVYTISWTLFDKEWIHQNKATCKSRTKHRGIALAKVQHFDDIANYFPIPTSIEYW